MQRSGAASRRFYAAFYRLTVRSANHTTTTTTTATRRTCVAGAGFGDRRANSSKSKASWTNDGKTNAKHQKRLQLHSFAGSIELLQQEPIQSTAERSSESLAAWEHAIRERSSSSVTVEISVPGGALHAEDLVRNLEAHEVQVRLPVSDSNSIENGEGETAANRALRPVLLSGDPVKVNEAWETLHSTGSHGPKRQQQQQHTSAVSQPTETPAPGPWEWTMKEGGEAGNVEVEFCIPEPVWKPLAEHGCVQWFQHEYQLQTDILDVRDGCAYLHLRGPHKHNRRARQVLMRAKRWTDEELQKRCQHIQRVLSEIPASSSSSSTVQPNEPLPGTATQQAAPVDEPLSGTATQQAAPIDLEKLHGSGGTPRSDKKVRMKRFAIPKHLQRHFDTPNIGPVAQIQLDSGLKALRWRPMAGSRHYLQVLGTDPALERAIPMLEELLRSNHNSDSGSGALPPPRFLDLIIPEHKFARPDPTHFAWIKIQGLAEDMSYIKQIIDKSLKSTDCAIHRLLAAGTRDLMLRGTEEGVEIGIADIQDEIDARRAKLGLPQSEIVVHKIGIIQDISRFTPWSDEDEAAAIKAAADAEPKSRAARTTSTQAKGAPASSGVTSDQPENAAAQLSNQKDDTNKAPSVSPSLSPLAESVRSSLGHLTQPVALITSTMPGGNAGNAQPGPRGVTVSSFTSVALSPTPIISFNLKMPSRTWDAIQQSRRLSVSLLVASPQGAAVAQAFTRPYERPEEPFESVARLGGEVALHLDGRPPVITWRDAVYATIDAELYQTRSIRFGDHRIVIANAMGISYDQEEAAVGLADVGALAYGMRGYRGLGGGIEPVVDGEAAVLDVESVEAATKGEGRSMPPRKTKAGKKLRAAWKAEAAERSRKELADVKTKGQDLWKDFMDDFEKDLVKDGGAAAKPADLTATKGPSASTVRTTQQKGQASGDLKDIGPSSPIMDKKALQRALEESDASYSTKGLPSQTANANPVLAEALKAAAGAYGERADAATTSPTTWKPQNPGTITQSSPRASHKKMTSNPQGVDYRPRGISDVRNSNPPPGRSFSTWTTARSTTRRNYSTSKQKKKIFKKTPPTTPNYKILDSTVEDYLCQIPTNNRLYNNLIAAQRQAERLESLIAHGSIPAEEIEDTKLESQAIRRRVARELAWRNAQDLRVLLDQGKVSSEKAQWLESELEQGQSVLLHEAKLLRTELEEGRVGKQKFDDAKKGLMADYDEFEGLLKRLRDLEEEDGFGFDDRVEGVGSGGKGRP